MQKLKRVKKFVSQLSPLALVAAMLLSNVAFAEAPKVKSSKAETTGKIRLGSVVTKSPNNYISLKQFNSELKDKVQEYQMVAAFTSIENTNNRITTKANGSKSIVSGTVIATYGQSLVDHKDGTKQASESISASIAFSISDNYTLVSRISANQDLQDQESEQKNGVSDLGIVLSQNSIDLADWLKGGFNISTVLPASEYSRKFQNYQGSLGLSYTFKLTEEVLAKGLSTSLSLGLSRNFHQFETDAAGKILNPYGAKEALALGYELKGFSFSLEFIHRHAWNYAGTVSEAFEHSEEVGYAITPKWGVALGHTNEGSWLAPNGRDSNLKLINEDDSIVYGSMSLMF